MSTLKRELRRSLKPRRAMEQDAVSFEATVSGDWKAKDAIANALNVKFTGSRWSGSKIYFSDRYSIEEVRRYADQLTTRYGGSVSFT